MIRRATELSGERRVNEPSFFYSTASTRASSYNPQVCKTATWNGSNSQAFASVGQRTRTRVPGVGI